MQDTNQAAAPASWLGFRLINQAAADEMGASVLPSDKALSGRVWLHLSDADGDPLFIAGIVVGVKFTAAAVLYSLAFPVAPQPEPSATTMYAVVDEIASGLVLAELPEDETVFDAVLTEDAVALMPTPAPVLDSADPFADIRLSADLEERKGTLESALRDEADPKYIIGVAREVVVLAAKLKGVALAEFDPTSPDGYAMVLKSEALALDWQDVLDSFFGGRVVDVRNALRGLGWDGERNGVLRKNGAATRFDFWQVGAGKNIVGMTVNGIRDELTMTVAELAAAIDATAALPEPAASSAQFENYRVWIEKQLGLGNAIPAGTLEQIRVDTRLNDGEAEKLEAIANGPAPVLPELSETFPGHKHAMMDAPTVLYRSVSPDELEAILSSGAIMGGSNKFNVFDTRREVFFSDKLNDQTVYQGEEITRRAENAMSEHPIQQQYRDALAAQEAHSNAIDAKYPMRVLQTPAEKKRGSELSARIAEIAAEARVLLDAELKSQRERHLGREFTSAVLETRPLDGGRHYSKRWGDSGMGADDEFGFDPGAVKLSDVTHIHLVKDRKIVKVVTPAELLAERNPAPAPNPEPAPAPTTTEKPSMDTLIKIAADTLAQLRRIDVYRVLDAAGEQRAELATYIATGRPDLLREVTDVMGEEWPGLGWSLTAPAVVEHTDGENGELLVPNKDGKPKELDVPPIEPEAKTEQEQSPARAGDMAFLNSVISQSVDMWDDELADKIEGMAGTYENDAEIMELVGRAITSYTDFMIAAA